MAILYALYISNFEQNYFRMFFIAAAYAFLVSFFEKPELNFVRLLISAVLTLALAAWLIPLLLKKTTFKSFFRYFNKIDGYFFIIILSLILIFLSIQIAFNFREGLPLLKGSFLCLKYFDYALLYLLIVKPVCLESFSEQSRVKFLVFSFLVSIVVITLTGAAKAFKAYSFVRATPDFTNSLDKNNYREKLLRVFSLNSREAFLLYEAGYKAGMKNWKESRELLDATDSYERFTVQEAKINTAIADSDFDSAIKLLERLPESYKFKNGNVISQLFVKAFSEDKAKLRIPKLQYLGGLLSIHCSLPQKPEEYLAEFLRYYPSHANAVFFINKIRKAKIDAGLLKMPASGWLKPKSEEKTVAENKDYLTIVYNQHIEGKLWLPKGKYKVSVFARDDGTTIESARKTGFNPACKMRVWVGNVSADFKVLSEDRKFKEHSFEVTINQVPVDFIIEFTNDIYDKTKNWDRNLSVSLIEFKSIKQ